MTIVMASAQLGPHWIQCPDCSGWFDPHSDMGHTLPGFFSEVTICSNCFERANLGYCASCNEAFSKDDLVDCAGAGWRCHDCAEDAGWEHCVCCNAWTNPNDQCETPGCNVCCSDCFYEYYGTCTDCGGCFNLADLYWYDGEQYCNVCLPGSSACVADFRPSGFRNHSGCTTKIGSERCFGLELETDDCDGYAELSSNGAWGAKNDPTCNGKEFYSAILDGDEGLKAVADLANHASKGNWEAGRDCGYHLHIDMRQENDDSLFAAAYAYRATQQVWHSFVHRSRHGNSYCHHARWRCGDIDHYVKHEGSFRQFVCHEVSGRYNWINLAAYDRHTSFEIRLHHASLDEVEVCNWIKANARFVDWATTLGLAGVKEKLDGKDANEMFDIVAKEAWQDNELRFYYAAKLVA